MKQIVWDVMGTDRGQCRARKRGMCLQTSVMLLTHNMMLHSLFPLSFPNLRGSFVDSFSVLYPFESVWQTGEEMCCSHPTVLYLPEHQTQRWALPLRWRGTPDHQGAASTPRSQRTSGRKTGKKERNALFRFKPTAQFSGTGEAFIFAASLFSDLRWQAWRFSTWGKVRTSCRLKWSSCWWILPSFTWPLTVCVSRCCLAFCSWRSRTRSLIFLRIRPGIKKKKNQEAEKRENDTNGLCYFSKRPPLSWTRSAYVSPGGPCHWCDGWQKHVKVCFPSLWSISGTVNIRH